MTKKIKMTKAETKAKDAGEKNSIKYEELKEYMEMYPTFEVLIKANTKRKVEFRGLDYKYMTRYIKMHDDENGSKIDFMNRTIVMTCQFAKECANPKSKEYEDLQSVRRDYPTYTVVRRTIKRNPHKESYRGLTYKYIKNYIESHCAEKMEEYKELRILAECHSVRYPEIKKWFLETFPEVARYGVKELFTDDNEEIENTLSISEVETVPHAA